jgi:CheY-like chemotaxis protein
MDGYELTRALRADPRYARAHRHGSPARTRGSTPSAATTRRRRLPHEASDTAVLIRTIDGLLTKLRAPRA